MHLTRCFVASSLRSGIELRLGEPAATHVARVLRARSGQLLTLFDGRGGEFAAEILQIDRRAVRVRIGDQHEV